jgi:hypothetical protein
VERDCIVQGSKYNRTQASSVPAAGMCQTDLFARGRVLWLAFSNAFVLNRSILFARVRVRIGSFGRMFVAQGHAPDSRLREKHKKKGFNSYSYRAVAY